MTELPVAKVVQFILVHQQQVSYVRTEEQQTEASGVCKCYEATD